MKINRFSQPEMKIDRRTIYDRGLKWSLKMNSIFLLYYHVMFSLFILVCVKVLSNFCFDLSALNSEIWHHKVNLIPSILYNFIKQLILSQFVFKENIEWWLEQTKYFHQRFVHPRQITDRDILLVQGFTLYFPFKEISVKCTVLTDLTIVSLLASYTASEWNKINRWKISTPHFYEITK